jgi:hypothetical protein
MVQAVGLIAHEYGYTLEYIGGLSLFQFKFLLDWIKWLDKKMAKRVKK